MHAEIIAIGTELTTGAKLDTNSQWLSIELAAVGVPVLLHSTIADDLPAMLGLLRAAVQRSDIVLITGGLGPTLDDLTRQALADLAGVELVQHEPSVQTIRDMFANRKRVMPERNLIQAMFPAGSEPIENSHGTAPGIWMELPVPCPLPGLKPPFHSPLSVEEDGRRPGEGGRRPAEGGRRPAEGGRRPGEGSECPSDSQSLVRASPATEFPLPRIGGEGQGEGAERSVDTRRQPPLTRTLFQRERGSGIRTCVIAAMPGVPSEMKPMFRDRVLPRLPHSNKVIRRARVNCYGVGESACEEKLGDLTARRRDPEVGITVHEGTITLRIEAHGATESECDAKIAQTKCLIRERLGPLVFGEEDEQLADVVVRELNTRGLTVAVADEVTGGLLSSWLTAVADSDRCFVGGLVGDSVGRILIPDTTTDGEQRARESFVEDGHSCPSTAATTQDEQRAGRLSEGVRQRFAADFALALTGSLQSAAADPTEIPRLYLALSDSHGTTTQEHIPVADISFARHRAAKSALDLLRLRLKSLSSIDPQKEACSPH